MWDAIWGSDSVDVRSNKRLKLRKHTELLLLKISVKGKQHAINIPKSACVSELKDLIKTETGLLTFRQVLVAAGHSEPLHDNATLGTEGLNLENGSNILCSVEECHNWKFNREHATKGFELLSDSSHFVARTDVTQKCNISPSFGADFSGCHMIKLEVKIPIQEEQEAWDKGVAVGLLCNGDANLWIWDSGLIEGDNTEGSYSSGIVQTRTSIDGKDSLVKSTGPAWKRTFEDGYPSTKNEIQLMYDSSACEISYWYNGILVFEGAKFAAQDSITDSDRLCFCVLSEIADSSFVVK